MNFYRFEIAWLSLLFRLNFAQKSRRFSCNFGKTVISAVFWPFRKARQTFWDRIIFKNQNFGGPYWISRSFVLSKFPPIYSIYDCVHLMSIVSYETYQKLNTQKRSVAMSVSYETVKRAASYSQKFSPHLIFDMFHVKHGLSQGCSIWNILKPVKRQKSAEFWHAQS